MFFVQLWMRVFAFFWRGSDMAVGLVWFGLVKGGNVVGLEKGLGLLWMRVLGRREKYKCHVCCYRKMFYYNNEEVKRSRQNLVLSLERKKIIGV